MSTKCHSSNRSPQGLPANYKLVIRQPCKGKRSQTARPAWRCEKVRRRRRAPRPSRPRILGVHVVLVAVLVLEVLDALGDRSVVPEDALLEDQHPVAHLADRVGRVADVEHRLAGLAHLLHARDALLLERPVAHGEHLVDQEDVAVGVHRDREPEPREHARTSSARRACPGTCRCRRSRRSGRTSAWSPPRSCRGSRRSGTRCRDRSAAGGSPAPVAISPAIRPRVSTWPASGLITPLISLSSVLLPEPLRPIRPTDSPSSMSKETSLTAGRCR